MQGVLGHGHLYRSGSAVVRWKRLLSNIRRRDSACKISRLSRLVPTMRRVRRCRGIWVRRWVAASLMARAGRRVAVLELGKEKWPGEYPSAMAD
ncbi:hypothetical protein IWX90DRAFT_203877 [Phyllosticta citrichinensis]|uniref:Uncharacterized protein n=1 Tax=Phyllosticta citrichinensis TaxID=1130410 RepID=A0ABR1XXT9_9PEZI